MTMSSDVRPIALWVCHGAPFGELRRRVPGPDGQLHRLGTNLPMPSWLADRRDTAGLPLNLEVELGMVCGLALAAAGTVRDGVLTRMTLEEDLLFEAFGRVIDTDTMATQCLNDLFFHHAPAAVWRGRRTILQGKRRDAR